MRSERSLNSLEALFASCNVRFSLLLIDGEFDVLPACKSLRLGHLSLKKDVRDEGEGEPGWKLVTDTTSSIVPEQDDEVVLEDFGDFLDELIGQTVPVEGPICLKIMPYAHRNKGKGMMLYVNGNHAMCDGRSLIQFIDLASSETSEMWKEMAPLPDWQEMLEAVRLENWQDEPSYLPHPAMSIQDLLGNHSHPITQVETFRFDVPGSMLKSLRDHMHHRAPQATWTGLLIAIILRALALERSMLDPNVFLGVSVLVDLRGYLSRDFSFPEVQLPQAHGTVTVVDSLAGILKNSSLDSLWEKSTEMTHQLRQRLSRGEALRSAVALTSGEALDALPGGTIELSNLGVCRIPENAKLFTAQRFDEYDGVSWMVHTDGNQEGTMRWTVSIGKGLDTTVLRRCFTKAAELCTALG